MTFVEGRTLRFNAAMETETWAALAAASPALAALFSLAVVMRAERSRQSRERSTIERHYFDRLYALYPKLVDVAGADDELGAGERKVLVPFFAVWSHVWWSYPHGVTTAEDRRGMRRHFEWWAAQPAGRRAWSIIGRYAETWPAGFDDYVGRVLREAEERPRPLPQGDEATSSDREAQRA